MINRQVDQRFTVARDDGGIGVVGVQWFVSWCRGWGEGFSWVYTFRFGILVV